MHKILTQLIASGLSEKEAAVYYAALKLGPTTILKIAQQTSLKRATVYTVVDMLMIKGLMRVDDSRLKRVFIAEDPLALKNIMQKRMEQVSVVIPELTKVYKKRGQDRTIKVYEGVAALEQISRRLMDESRRGDFRYFIGGDTGWKDVDSKVQEKYFKWRERAELDVRLLFQESERAILHKQHAKRLRQEVKVLPRKMKLNSDIIITPKMLVITKLTAPQSAVVIEDPDIINSYKELFLFMWRSV